MTTQVYGGLYVGDIDDVQQGNTGQFDRVITVCQDNVGDNVGCAYEHFNLADGDDQQGHNPGEYSYELLADAIDSVVAARLRRETVLVHCHAGQSRSVTVCIAALCLVEGFDWNEAYNIVADVRPNLQPGRRLVTDGKRYVEERQ